MNWRFFIAVLLIICAVLLSVVISELAADILKEIYNIIISLDDAVMSSEQYEKLFNRQFERIRFLRVVYRETDVDELQYLLSDLKDAIKQGNEEQIHASSVQILSHIRVLSDSLKVNADNIF